MNWEKAARRFERSDLSAQSWDRLHVDSMAEIGYVGAEKVVFVPCERAKRLPAENSFHASQVVYQQ